MRIKKSKLNRLIREVLENVLDEKSSQKEMPAGRGDGALEYAEKAAESYNPGDKWKIPYNWNGATNTDSQLLGIIANMTWYVVGTETSCGTGRVTQNPDGSGLDLRWGRQGGKSASRYPRPGLGQGSGGGFSGTGKDRIHIAIRSPAGRILARILLKYGLGC
jgi:hypothetical protein